eukprot:SAG31_NODE_221_length_19918_cov_8.483829_10_plen_210_part_00
MLELTTYDNLEVQFASVDIVCQCFLQRDIHPVMMSAGGYKWQQALRCLCAVLLKGKSEGDLSLASDVGLAVLAAKGIIACFEAAHSNVDGTASSDGATSVGEKGVMATPKSSTTIQVTRFVGSQPPAPSREWSPAPTPEMWRLEAVVDDKQRAAVWRWRRAYRKTKMYLTFTKVRRKKMVEQAKDKRGEKIAAKRNQKALRTDAVMRVI